MLKVYLLVTYLYLYPNGDVQSQSYWYLELNSMQECSSMVRGGIDFGSVVFPSPELVQVMYKATCIEAVVDD